MNNAIEDLTRRSTKAFPAVSSALVLSTGLFLGGCAKPKHTANTPTDIPSLSLAEAQIRNSSGVRRVVEAENVNSGNFTVRFEDGDKLFEVRGVGVGPERTAFRKFLSENGIAVLTSNDQDLLAEMERTRLTTEKNTNQLMLLMLIAVGISATSVLLTRKALGEAGSKNIASQMKKIPADRFSDIGGCQENISRLEEIVRDIERVKEGTHPFASVPNGIMLAGAKGVGKTSIARAFAGHAQVPFLYLSGSELTTSQFAGAAQNKIISTYKEIRKARDSLTKFLRLTQAGRGNGVVILFIDEFDSLGMNRGEGETALDLENRRIVNTLLAELANVDPERNKNIIIMIATNNPEALDPALMRSGRFPVKIEITAPRNRAERLDTIEKLTKRIQKTDAHFSIEPEDMEFLAAISEGCTGDDLHQVMLAAAKDIRRDVEASSRIPREAFFDAFMTQRIGPKITHDILTPPKATLRDAHEHGHALAAIASGLDVLAFSGTPRGKTGGMVVVDHGVDAEGIAVRSELRKAMLYLYGGRAGEEMIGEPSTAVGQDFEVLDRVIDQYILGAMDGEVSFGVDSPESGLLREELIARAKQNLREDVECAAADILREVGTENLERLIERGRTKDELLGEEAMNFYAEVIPPDVLSKMKGAASEFIFKPRSRVRFATVA